MKLIQAEIIEPILTKLFYTDPKYCSLLSNVFDAEWFDDEGLGECVNLICKYYNARQTLPKTKTVELLITKRFSDEEDQLEALTRFKSTYSIDLDEYDRTYLEEEVVKRLKNGGIHHSLRENLDEISERQYVDGLVEQLTFLSNMRFDMDIGMDYIQDHEEHRNELSNPEAKVSTGWSTLDYKTAGGWLKEGRCMALFMGQTHIGKSLILSNMAANMFKDNKFVVVISLEMSQHVYATRVDAHLSEIDINTLKDNTETLKDRVEIISETHPEGKILIKEFPPDSISCANIRTYIDRVIQIYGRKPDAILIDYLSLLLPENKSDGSYDKYKQVATGMRTLSYTFNTPVISVYQSNREGFDTTDPSLANSADSMGVPMTADFVAGLFQEEGDKEAGIMNMRIMKNRLGGFIGSKLTMHINYNTLKITDMKKSVESADAVGDELADELSDLEDL